MASTFTALPLESGESFLLRTEALGRKFVILVDSGKKYAGKKHPLHKVLKKHAPNVQTIDVAICTHQDADHSNGFRNFADEWYAAGGMIGEYWLPGRWANVAKPIALGDESFQRSILEGANEAVRALANVEVNNSDLKRAEIYLQKIPEDDFREQAKSYNLSKELRPCGESAEKLNLWEHGRDESIREKSLAASLGLSTDDLTSRRAEMEESDPLDKSIEFAMMSLNSRFFYHLKDRPYETKVLNEYNLAIDTAASIRRILESALKHTIPIRWFDFGAFELGAEPSGGINGVLEPLNAVEVDPPIEIVSNVAKFYSLRLSRQNVESLVFYRPETDEAPGVLFLGDSRLAFGISKPKGDFSMPVTRPKRPLIITSPHHGSRVNDHAYSVIEKWVGKAPYYIRNGGQTGQKLKDYPNKPSRKCAQCVQCFGKNWQQLVTLDAKGYDWDWKNISGKDCGTPKQ